MTMILPELQAEILALHFGGKLGTRAIANRLGINRKAVRRVLERRQVSLRPQVVEHRSSILDPFKPRIEQMLKRDPALTVSRILQQLRGEGFLAAIPACGRGSQHSASGPIAHEKRFFGSTSRRVRPPRSTGAGSARRLTTRGEDPLLFDGAVPLAASLYRVYAQQEVRGVHPLSLERLQVLWPACAT